MLRLPQPQLISFSLDRMIRCALFAKICLAFVVGSMSSVAQDNVHSVDAKDAEMLAAINKARSEFGRFMAAFIHPAEGQQSFLVKVAFTEGDEVEHIWLADLDFAAARPTGVIGNEPKIKRLHFKQRVEFDPKYISDWMYIDHGKLIGGYTTRLLRQRMSPEERKKFDASLPYVFDNAPTI